MDGLSQLKLIKKGAEASLYLATWHGRQVTIKKRIPKNYRLVQLDDQIRGYRTVHESQLLHEAKMAGVPTPFVFFVNKPDSMIVMEHIQGIQVKKLLSQISSLEKRRLSFIMGCLIGKLHLSGIVHGDLTTSNMILAEYGDVVFVDFGLGEKNSELEAYGVDLHLMKRALQSTHFNYAETCFGAVMEGYSNVVGAELAKDVLVKIGEIEKRGRYVSERKV